MLKNFLKRSSKEDYLKHLYVLILAGGGGTRLWPRSRNKTPKQFLKLFEGKTLTQITVTRLLRIIPIERIFIITVSDAYKKEILKEIPDFHPGNIMVEPDRKDTAPAHGLGALYIYKKDPDAVIITESADRLVKPITRYLDTLLAGAKTAYEEKKLLAMGVEPRYPNPGYGHIKRGKKFKSISDIDFYVVDKFVEKPPLELAKKYTASGEYYWNAGQFIWRADVFLQAIKNHARLINESLNKIEPSIGTKDEVTVLQREYKNMPNISIDYAVVEKEKNFLLIAADFYWTDIGDWKEVWGNLPKDSSGNVIISGDEKGGEVINIDTTDAFIHTDGRLIAAVDVDNLIIVDTKEALLVCSKSHAQSVKKVVELLKSQDKLDLL